MADLINIINRTGNGFCSFALTMLIQSSILIVLLYLIDLLIRKHVRAVFRYCIWMLVFLKLILPTTLCLPTGIGYWCGLDILSANHQTSSNAKMPVQVTTEEADSIAADYDLEHLPPTPIVLGQPARATVPTITDDGTYMPPIQPSELESASVATAEPGISITWQAVVFLIWLIGVFVLSVLLLQRFLFVKSLLAQSDTANGSLQETLNRCRQQVGVRKQIEFRLSKNMLSPAACGLSKPIILMPAALLDTLDEDKLRAVLIHELAHIKRGDLWVNFIQTILQIIYFYNPLLWFANAVVRGIREKAVDEMVLTKLGNEADSYSSTLIDIAEIAFSRPHFSLRLVGVVESKKALSGRIKHILSRPFPKSAKLGIVSLAAIIIAALILLPMAKADSKPPSLVIKGTVTDSQTGSPIAGAKVFDDGYAEDPDWDNIAPDKISEWGAVTNSNGQYSFLTWPEHHGIKVHAPGYKAKRKSLYSGHFTFNKKDTEVLDFALEKAPSEELKIPTIPTEYIGHWKGQAKIIVNWTKQKHLPIDIEIHSDGTIEGKVGDAELVNGKLVKKSWVYTKVFQHENPYRIVGDLQGEIIKSENIQRDSVHISIRVEDSKIDGGLGTSGTKTGGKENMILSAMDVSLIRVDKNDPAKAIVEAAFFSPDFGSIFTRVLSNGVTVELISVCKARDNQRCWAPDGSLFSKTPYYKSGAWAGSEKFEFAFRVKNLDEEQSATSWKIDGKYATMSGNREHPTNEAGKEITDLWIIDAKIIEGIQKCNVSFGVAAGSWQTQAKCVGIQGMVTAKDQHPYTFSQAYVHNDMVCVTVSDDMVKLAKRLIAIDNNGNTHLSESVRTGSTRGLRQSTFGFKNLKLEDIKEFQFQTQPYEWAEFKNILLKPKAKIDATPFRTTLPNGITVELLGICDFDLEHQQCWGPNGKDIDRALFVTESTDGNKEHNQRARGFILRTNMPSEIQWQKAPGQTDWFCCSTVVDDQGNKLERDNYYGKKIWLDGRNKTDLSIRIAPEKWQTKAVYDGKYVIGKADNRVRFIESYDSADGLKVVFQSNFSDKEIRLDALVKGNGQTVITAKISQVTDSLGNKNDVAIFDSMGFAQIRNFQFKIRPKMEKVIFKNVSLKPNFNKAGQVEEKIPEEQSTGKLEFRIVPNHAPSGQAPSIEPTVLKDYTDTLLVKGPNDEIWRNSPRYSKYKWVLYDDDAKDIGITVRHNDKRFGLLCNELGFTMLADGTWGLQRVNPEKDHMGRLAVGFEFDIKGGESFYELTSNNLMNRLAIIIDSKIYSAPQINSAIRGQGVITGTFSEAEVKELVGMLSNGMPAVVPRAEGQQPGFEPTIEITLNDNVAVGKNSNIDFDTGRLFPRPKNWQQLSDDDWQRWIEKTGVDASGATRATVRGLMCDGMIFLPSNSSWWEKTSAHALATMDLWKKGKPGRPAYMAGKGELPATYIFKTSEDGIGILQITGFNNDPKGVNIRYKMLQKPQDIEKNIDSELSLFESYFPDDLEAGKKLTTWWKNKTTNSDKIEVSPAEKPDVQVDSEPTGSFDKDGAVRLMREYVAALVSNDKRKIEAITVKASPESQKFTISMNEAEKLKNVLDKSKDRGSAVSSYVTVDKRTAVLVSMGEVKRIDGLRYSLRAVMLLNNNSWVLKDVRWYRAFDMQTPKAVLRKYAIEGASSLTQKTTESLIKGLSDASLQLIEDLPSGSEYKGFVFDGHKVSIAQEDIASVAVSFVDALRNNDKPQIDARCPSSLRHKLYHLPEECQMQAMQIDHIYSNSSFAIIVTDGIQRNDRQPHQLGFSFIVYPGGKWVFRDIDWIDSETRLTFVESFKNNFPDAKNIPSRPGSQNVAGHIKTLANSLIEYAENYGNRFPQNLELVAERQQCREANLWETVGQPIELTLIPDGLGFVMSQRKDKYFSIMYNEALKRFEITDQQGKRQPQVIRMPLARISSEDNKAPGSFMEIGIPSWH